MEAVASFIISSAMLVLAAGAGRRLMSLLGLGEVCIAARLALSAALGLGIVSLVIFGFGVLQQFKPPWIHLSWVVFGVLAAPGFRTLGRDAGLAFRQAATVRHDRAAAAVCALLLLLAATALIPAMTPPSMTDWDSLAYHLAVPKLYMEHGGIHYIDFISHSNFPFLMEMLYVPGLALGLPIAGKLMHYWTGVLLVVTVGALAAERAGMRAGLLAALGLAGMPLVLWEAGTAYVDLAAGLYTIAAVYVCLQYIDKHSLRVAGACGVAAGFAASTKMTALAAIPLLGVWIGLHHLFVERRGWLAAAVTVVVLGLVVCSPWYLRSFIYTGNPVYPFFYGVFGGRDWNTELADNYSALQAQFGVGHDFAAFLLAPYDLTFSPEKFYDTPGLYAGPLLLAAVPIIFLALRAGREAAGLACFAFAQYCIWFALTQQSRYLVPAFAVVSALTAWVLYRTDGLRVTRGIVWAVFSATALFGLWTVIPAVQMGAPFVSGRQSAEEYLRRTLDIFPAQEWMNENLPASAGVALFGDTRGFYLDRRYVWADYGHNVAFSKEFSSVYDFTSYIRQSGLTHAMVNYRFLPEKEKAQRNAALVYEAVELGLFEQVFPAGEATARVRVYRVR